MKVFFCVVAFIVLWAASSALFGYVEWHDGRLCGYTDGYNEGSKVSDRIFRADAVKRGYAHWEIITDSDRSEPKPKARFAWNTQSLCQSCKGSGICGYGSFGHYASYPVPCEDCLGSGIQDKAPGSKPEVLR